MYFFLILVLMTLLSASTLLHHQNESMPQWIKKDARFWHDGKISEEEFVNSIKWSVENKIIPIRYAIIGNHIKQETPQEFKNISYFWSIGLVSDKDYIGTIRYLMKNDVIQINGVFVSEMNHDMKSVSVFNETRKSIVIIPVLTSSAYSENGFYAHYRESARIALQ